MSSPCNRGATKHALIVLTAVMIGAVHSHRADAQVLTICIDEANPTAATDARLARAIGKSQGYAVKIATFLGLGKGGEGLPPSRFAKMAQAQCELIMGFPVDVSDPNLPPDVKATLAYAGTGFVMVRRRGSARESLDELPRGSEVGITQLDTYAGLLFQSHPNLVMHVYPRDSEMLQALASKHIAAAVGWQPTIETQQVSHAAYGGLSVTTLPGRHMAWNLVALYAEQSRPAAEVFEHGLHALESDGRLDHLIAPFQRAAAPPAVPARAPSASLPAIRDRGYLRSAVAWSQDVGQITTVSDTGGRAQTTHSKPPALYTADQAAKGELAYYQNCAMCHGPQLDGQAAGYSGPALKGPDFADPSYDFHVSDIFNFVAKLMPAATPGSLSHEQDVQIMAFILKRNGYPAGAQELVYEVAEKSRVPLRYFGK